MLKDGQKPIATKHSCFSQGQVIESVCYEIYDEINYYGSVHYNDYDKVFYGKVAFIRALVSYEGTDIKSMSKSFEEAVEDYLQTCREQGKEARGRSIYGSVQRCTSVLCQKQ
jgi:hypothetical protein